MLSSSLRYLQRIVVGYALWVFHSGALFEIEYLLNDHPILLNLKTDNKGHLVGVTMSWDSDEAGTSVSLFISASKPQTEQSSSDLLPSQPGTSSSKIDKIC